MEKDIEKFLREEVKKKGGRAVKFVSPGLNGVPDRIVLMPPGKIAFVELKDVGRKLTKKQKLRTGQLAEMGFAVYTIDSKPAVSKFMEDFCRDICTS